MSNGYVSRRKHIERRGATDRVFVTTPVENDRKRSLVKKKGPMRDGQKG